MFQVKTRIVFGTGALDRLGEFSFGEKCLLVCGKHLVNELDDIKRKIGVSTRILTNIKPEPSVGDLRKYWEEISSEDYDFIVAIGGGSVLDVSKILAALISNNNEIEDFIGVDKIVNEIKPLIAIPTTHGSGSEVTRYAVLKHGDSKKTVSSENICPRIAIVDPQLSVTLPKDLTAYTALDALTHNLEAYISKRSDPLIDSIAILGVKIGLENVEQGYENGEDICAREKLALASVLGGLCITNASAGIVHALSHVLGMYGVLHGQGNAMFLPYSMRFNYDEKLERLEKMLGIDLFERLNELNERFNVPRLGEIIGKSEAKELAEKAFENKRLMSLNPKEITVNDLIGIVEESR